MRLARFAVAALLLLVPACGSGDSGVSESAATRLEPKAQALREAAAAGNEDAAIHELADLRGLVEELSTTDELSQRAARRILAAAERVEANLALLATTTTAPPTTTTAPPPPPPPADEEEDKEEEEEEKKEEEKKEEVDTTTTVDESTPDKGNDGKGKD